jgi:cytochrome c5
MPMFKARRWSIAAVGCLFLLASVAQPANPPRPAADIYRDYCAVCHSGGWQGAPIANDAGEWKERVSAGAETLFKNAKQGLNAMPAMGTCMDCSDEELESAIAEMLPQS